MVKALEGVLEDVSTGSLDEDILSEDESEGEFLVLEDGDMAQEQEQEQEKSQLQEPPREKHNPDPTPTPTPTPTPAPTTTTEAPTSTLRNRHNPQPTTTPKQSSQDQTRTQTTEQALSTDRLEQETLTDSLLSLATQLKSSSTAFHASLENEKSVLDRAVNGLDATTASMNAAEKRMGMLRKMTEGKGWWGRMLLNLWIVALWVVAILIVFVGPKFRF